MASPGQPRLVSIGPVTSEALRERGLQPHVEAEQHDIDGLVRGARQRRAEDQLVSPPVITFLSDYGLEDVFVGVCHGVIAGICPRRG